MIADTLSYAGSSTNCVVPQVVVGQLCLNAASCRSYAPDFDVSEVPKRSVTRSWAEIARRGREWVLIVCHIKSFKHVRGRRNT